jgi:predicted  nucleic acid-binding Zn-ribbon protein
MEELLKQILARLEGLESKVDSIESKVEFIESKVDSIESKMATKEDIKEVKSLLMEFHGENISADEKLLEGIRTTNDRLDFQRDKVIKVEEELYLIKQKQ